MMLWLKNLIVRIGFGDRLIEYCQACGRRQPLVWWADEDLWWKLVGSHAGAFCPECFDHMATCSGIGLRWKPEIHSAWQESEHKSSRHKLWGTEEEAWVDLHDLYTDVIDMVHQVCVERDALREQLNALTGATLQSDQRKEN